MKADPKLIELLEHEAAALRHRIDGLSQRTDYPGGVTTGDAAPGPAEREEADDRARLAEVEEHLRALKREAGDA